MNDMKRNLLNYAICCMVCIGFTPVTSGQNPLKYPSPAKTAQVDNFFGEKVADPYRWMEYDTATNVRQWVEEENKVTNGYLDQIPYRGKIKERLTEIINYPKYSAPYKAGEYFIYQKNDGLQNQSVYYVQKGQEATPEVLLDPNKLSSDGTAAVSIVGYSMNKKYAAFTVNQSGSDWENIYILDIENKKQLADRIEWAKFTGAAFKADGFYYSCYDKPEVSKSLSEKNEYHKIYFHKIGDLQSKDLLVYQDKAHPLRYFSAQTTEDEKYLFVYGSEGTDGTEVYYQNLADGQKELKLLLPGFKYNYNVLDNVGSKFLVYTNDGAPNYHVVMIDPSKPDKKNWEEIIPEKPEYLEGVTLAGGKMFATYLKDVCSRVYRYDLTGKPEGEISLPSLGTATVSGGNRDDKSLFYTFTSFTYPPTIYKYDIQSQKSEVFKKSEVKINSDEFETKQVFYTSKDGTKIPMFIVSRKGLKQDGTNPTLLYGYGGFNISLTPTFSASRMILLENGGIYALANLRGGGEYGESWHKAGMLDKKQNVFDDFIAAAEYLIKEKYTQPSKLAIQGGSNGGLLIGACMTQRPELYKVAFPAVGVMDMLRFHRFTVGWGWVVEYGCADSLKDFKNIYKYSPLHNLKSGVEYPATMITTADHDDRVVPAHSFKFAATLQEKQKGTNPVLIRIDVKAGHGAGKPISKVIAEQADIWSFMFYNMGVKY